VFTALGLGPVTAGAPFSVIGSPEFPQAVIAPQGGGAPFTISAPDASDANPYVLSGSLNGAPLGRAWLYDSALATGGRLDLAMGSSPDESWGAGQGDVPPSVSDSGLERFGCRG
jgi:putative alpha-1,2-mannosidase